MEQNKDNAKDSFEWKSLNAIWKSCSPEQRFMLKSDFEIVAKFIKKHTYHKCSDSANDDYAYLNSISDEAKQFVISVVDEGEKNIYHSVMAILNNKSNLSEKELKEYYFNKYGSKRPYLLENTSLVCEVISLCWHNFHSKRISTQTK